MLKLNRRQFLKWIGSLAFLSALMSLFRFHPKAEVVRPPGAIDEEKFLAVCLRCEKCVRACPKNFIKPAGIEKGLTNIGTPCMEGVGVLEYNGAGTSEHCAPCVRCVDICPVNALVRGTANVNKDICVKCYQCIWLKFCPIEAMEIGEDYFPTFFEEKCVGCGYCAAQCPLAAITIKRNE